MRKNKFRAFDSDSETMKMIYSDEPHDGGYCFTLDGEYVQCLLNYCYCDAFGDDHDNWQPLDNIMQYTGFKDINGKGIYEGDVVEVEAQCIGGRDFKGVVKFYECGFFIDNGEDAIPLFDEVDPRIVLGNVYENPEFLAFKILFL